MWRLANWFITYSKYTNQMHYINRGNYGRECTEPLCTFFFLRAEPTAYGASQARGRIGAVAAGLRHSHRHSRSKPCLQSTPQLTAMLDP